MVHFLAEKGVDVNDKTNKYVRENFIFRGSTPLCLSIQLIFVNFTNMISTVSALIECGANVNNVDV